MKAIHLIKSAPSRLALFVLMNVITGHAAANNAKVEPVDGAATIESLQRGFAEQRELLATQTEQLKHQEQQIREQAEQLQAMEDQLRQLVSMRSGGTKDESGQTNPIIALEPAGERPAQPAEPEESGPSEQSVAQRREDAEKLRDVEDPMGMEDEELPGYLQVPGTDSSMKLGGFVKMSIVQSADQVGSADRFIVGTIPVTGEDAVAANEASLTTRQSRLNLDVRRRTELGPLRAFIEGDFAEEGDTFRLRHAYGQFRNLLAGQTWSTFVDTQAVPEDIDFEGLNGRVNVRQPQLRYFPNIGRHLQFSVAIEDPSPTSRVEQASPRCPILSLAFAAPGGTGGTSRARSCCGRFKRSRKTTRA